MPHSSSAKERRALPPIRIVQVLSGGSEADGVCRIARLIAMNLPADRFQTTFLFLTRQIENGVRQDLDRAGIKYVCVDAVSSAHPKYFLRNVRAARQVRRYLTQSGFDIVHGHNFFSGSYACECSKDIPVVQTLHGMGFVRNPSWVRRFLQQRAIRRAHAVVGISQAITDMLRRAYPFERDKCVTIYDGIDTRQVAWNVSSATVRRQLGISADSPVIGTVGMLEERKGHQFAIQALPRIRRYFPKARLLVVGRRPWYEPNTADYLRRLAYDCGVYEAVIFTGFRRDVPNLMHAMDVFVHAPLSEGFGLVVCEAMNVGTPVVAFNVEGVAEIIEHGSSGLLVQKGDVTDLARQVVRVLRDTQLSQALSKGGRVRVRERFTAQRMAMEYGELYERLASG